MPQFYPARACFLSIHCPQVVVSFVEIYQEKIRDLLDMSKDDLKIGSCCLVLGSVFGAYSQLHRPSTSSMRAMPVTQHHVYRRCCPYCTGEIPSGGVYIKEATGLAVMNAEEVLEIMRSGEG